MLTMARRGRFGSFFVYLIGLVVVAGAAFTGVCWATPWIVPGVQRLPSGMFYTAPGPLTGVFL